MLSRILTLALLAGGCRSTPPAATPKTAFLGIDGHADPTLYGDDFLHLSVAGYETLGGSIAFVLRRR